MLSLGVETIGHLAALDDAALRELFGSWGEELRDLARGVDVRSVEPERETKSISSEETFEYDVSDEKVLIATIKSQAIEIAAKLQRENLSAQTVGVKLKRTNSRPSAGKRISPNRPATRGESIAPPCSLSPR